MPWEKNTHKKTSSVPIEKEVTKIDKDGKDIVATIPYKTKFVYSVRLMVCFLWKFRTI